MAAATLFERLTRRSARDQQKTIETFEALAAACLDGKTPDEDSAATILETCGKTPGDLADAVRLLGQRRVWAATVEAAEGGEKRLAEIESELRDLDVEQTNTKARWATEEDALGNERNGLLVQSAGGTEAETRLRESCQSAIKNRERELIADKQELLAQRGGLLRELGVPPGERDSSSDLRMMLQKREYCLRRQQGDEPIVSRRAARDAVKQDLQTADELAQVNTQIAAEKKRIKPAWAKIEVLDKKIEAADGELRKLAQEKLRVI